MGLAATFNKNIKINRCVFMCIKIKVFLLQFKDKTIYILQIFHCIFFSLLDKTMKGNGKPLNNFSQKSGFKRRTWFRV